MEILAEKKRGLILLYFFAAILSTLLFTLMYFKAKSAIVILPVILPVIVIGSIAIDVMCIVICVWIKRTPERITYENGKVDFGNGYVTHAENITKVEYRRVHARGWSYKWGKLTVYVEDRVLVYRYMADVEEAHNRIINVMLEAKKGK